jgi:hypothetical protein
MISFPSASPSTEIDAHVNELLNSHTKNPNLSLEELVEVSKTAAASAIKAARALRAAADKKAAIAAKAMAAAKSALELVAFFNEEAAASKERFSKKKKHVPVQHLYKKHRPLENCSSRADEELAHRLHRTINSSPRISKTHSRSHHKANKKLKSSSTSTSERIAVPKGVLIVRPRVSISNGHSLAGSSESEDSDRVEKVRQLYGEAESSRSKEKTWEESFTPSRKRGRVKLKKLPLSVCSIKDQVSPKEKTIIRSSHPLNENPTANNVPLFSLEPTKDGFMPVEATPFWKYKELNASPACVKQNKVMQS